MQWDFKDPIRSASLLETRVGAHVCFCVCALFLCRLPKLPYCKREAVGWTALI